LHELGPLLSGELTGEPPIQESDAVRILRVIQDMKDIPGMRVAMKKSLLSGGQECIESECIDELTG